jgi:hypothetical protein
MPSSLALSALMITRAAAPSLIPEALPAATVPSFLKAGLSPQRASSLVPSLGYSSVSKTTCLFGFDGDGRQAPVEVAYGLRTITASFMHYPPAEVMFIHSFFWFSKLPFLLIQAIQQTLHP